jgi:inosose dehydratase
MSFRIGCAPIVWNNEDQSGAFGSPVPFERLLDEVVSTGYSGTELGLGFPREPSQLRRGLDDRGLELTSAWCGLALLDPDPEPDLEHTRKLCGLIAEAGASFVNLAHQGTPERSAVAGRADEPGAPRLTSEAWDRLVDRVCQAAEVAREHGLQAAFHAHVGTWIETQAEVEELLRRTPESLLKLCWDVGHAIYGGIDPVRAVRDDPERIAYVHLKDVDAAVLAQLRDARLDFGEGIRRRVFTEVGRGCLDVPALLAALREIGYAGWLMVEQDSTWHSPMESARLSRTYLRELGV